MRRCPKCKSKDVVTERRPEGDSTCRHCSHHAPSREFVEKIDPVLEFKATFFASLAGGGHLQSFYCVQASEFGVVKEKKDRNANWTIEYSRGEKKFDSKDAFLKAIHEELESKETAV